jgi:hypothetical protein
MKKYSDIHYCTFNPVQTKRKTIVILKFSYSITYYMYRLVSLLLLILGIIFTQFGLTQSDDKEAGHVIGDAVNSNYVTIKIIDINIITFLI